MSGAGSCLHESSKLTGAPQKLRPSTQFTHTSTISTLEVFILTLEPEQRVEFRPAMPTWAAQVPQERVRLGEDIIKRRQRTRIEETSKEPDVQAIG
ncbi:hypothetical protein VNI00_012917 [Paramarasmius palmivorus]|uniref:Uncharacterized protein n=1 Tax=Paramarasmius palmivorus TaxID=297713 RepID=A0AAW0C1Y2_9AGAR